MKKLAKNTRFFRDNLSNQRVRIERCDPVEETLVRKVALEQFGLGRCHDIKKICGSGLSTNYRIRGENGPIIIKISGYNDPKALEERLGIFDYCAGRGARMPGVIRTLDGKLFGVENGLNVCAFPYAEGRYFGGNETEMADLAGELTVLHDLFRDYQKKTGLARLTDINMMSGFNEGAFVSDVLDSVGSMIDKKRAHDMTDDVTMAILRRYGDVIKASLMETRQRDPASEQIIHGDLHTHNALFQDGGLRAIIDFDAVRMGQRTEDFSFCLYIFIRQMIVANGESGNGQKIEKWIGAFMDAYDIKNNLPAGEIRQLNSYIYSRIGSNLAMCLYDYYIDKARTDAGYLKKLEEKIGYRLGYLKELEMLGGMFQLEIDKRSA